MSVWWYILKSLLRRLKNIGMVSKKLYRNTLKTIDEEWLALILFAGYLEPIKVSKQGKSHNLEPNPLTYFWQRWFVYIDQ